LFATAATGEHFGDVVRLTQEVGNGYVALLEERNVAHGLLSIKRMGLFSAPNTHTGCFTPRNKLGGSAATVLGGRCGHTTLGFQYVI